MRFSSDYSDSPEILDHKNQLIYNGRYITRVTHYALFGKPYLHLPVNTIYSTIHIIPTILSHIQYNYIDIQILL